MKGSTFTFHVNHIFIEEEDNPSKKVVTIGEKLDGIDIDGVGNLMDLPSSLFIDEECGNLKVVNDGR